MNTALQTKTAEECAAASSATPAIFIEDLRCRYGKTEAVQGLDLCVRPGRCYGLFGRNGAGKTTTIKCILNHLRPASGQIRVFGSSPQKDEVAVKAHLSYVPEIVSFYPWMSVREVLDYSASFRTRWNRELQEDLLRRFELDPSKRVDQMSKGMRAQLGLICAVCPEPHLLLLDEPTSGLDPIVRREFLETVIGAYQEADPQRRTVFVSTHLIQEFEGLIDEFTIIDQGKSLFTMEADQARERFKRIRMRFAGEPPAIAPGEGISQLSREGHELVLLARNYSPEQLERLQGFSPEALEVENLSLEEIFVAAARQKGA